MQGVPTDYTAAELITVALAAVLVGLLAVIGYRAWQRSRVTAEERERGRCAPLVDKGAVDSAGVSRMSVRSAPRNPATSIVGAEEGSGLGGAARLLPENHASH